MDTLPFSRALWFWFFAAGTGLLLGLVMLIVVSRFREVRRRARSGRQRASLRSGR